MKILSLIDVITNSSTEVFTYIDKYSITNLKKVINAILKICDSPNKFDDLFDIKINLRDGDTLEEMFKDEFGRIPGEGELVEYALRQDDYPHCESFTLISKTNHTKEVEIISKNLDSIYFTDEFCC